MKHARFTSLDLLAALAVVVIWGLNFVAMKFALHDFTPFQLGAARFAVAVLPLVFFIRPPRLHWKWVVLFGLFQGLGQFGFLFMALKVGMTAALASVLAQTQIFFTAIFSFVLLHERAGRALQAGLLLAALGLACFAMNYLAPHLDSAKATTALGFVLSLGAAAMWAGSNIVARKAQLSTAIEFDALAFVVWSSLVPILPFIGLTLWFDDGAVRWLSLPSWRALPLSSWFAIGYLGWAATIGGYGLWTQLLKRHTANRVAPFGLGVPVVGLAAGMLVLGETITAWQWAGIALVILSLICVLFGDKYLNRIRL
ncbi:MAG: EamA family transporter [Rhodoferax sp.]